MNGPRTGLAIGLAHPDVDYCARCERPFTDVEWDNRHADFDGEDIHSDCCEANGPCSDRKEST